MQSDKRKENRREWGQTEKGEQSIKNSRSNYSNSGKREQTRKIWERTETGKKSTKQVQVVIMIREKYEK